MRIEKREKKVYEEIYIADDGTQFDTKRHCLEYEKKMKCVKRLRMQKSLEYVNLMM